jgi:hypothetical protein
VSTSPTQEKLKACPTVEQIAEILDNERAFRLYYSDDGRTRVAEKIAAALRSKSEVPGDVRADATSLRQIAKQAKVGYFAMPQDIAEEVDRIADRLEALGSNVSEPLPMLLFCPRCHLQHLDGPDECTPDWDNPPHRSHLCHGCGCIWRPADVPTVGVAAIQTQGKADNWQASDSIGTPVGDDVVERPTYVGPPCSTCDVKHPFDNVFCSDPFHLGEPDSGLAATARELLAAQLPDAMKRKKLLAGGKPSYLNGVTAGQALAAIEAALAASTPRTPVGDDVVERVATMFARAISGVHGSCIKRENGLYWYAGQVIDIESGVRAALAASTPDVSDRVKVLEEALSPFAAMGRVMETRAVVTFGKQVPDSEIVCGSSGEVGLGVLTMGHFRDATALLPKAPGWGGMYRPPFDRAALTKEMGRS